MHIRLDIACTVATSVQISDYANHSSNYLHHHQHIDLRPCFVLRRTVLKLLMYRTRAIKDVSDAVTSFS